MSLASYRTACSPDNLRVVGHSGKSEKTDKTVLYTVPGASVRRGLEFVQDIGVVGWVASGAHQGALGLELMCRVSRDLMSPPTRRLAVPQGHSYLQRIPVIQQAVHGICARELPPLVDGGRGDGLARLGAERRAGQEGLIDAPQEHVLELAVGAQAVLGPQRDGAEVVLVRDLRE